MEKHNTGISASTRLKSEQTTRTIRMPGVFRASCVLTGSRERLISIWYQNWPGRRGQWWLPASGQGTKRINSHQSIVGIITFHTYVCAWHVSVLWRVDAIGSVPDLCPTTPGFIPGDQHKWFSRWLPTDTHFPQCEDDSTTCISISRGAWWVEIGYSSIEQARRVCQLWEPRIPRWSEAQLISRQFKYMSDHFAW